MCKCVVNTVMNAKIKMKKILIFNFAKFIISTSNKHHWTLLWLTKVSWMIMQRKVLFQILCWQHNYQTSQKVLRAVPSMKGQSYILWDAMDISSMTVEFYNGYLGFPQDNQISQAKLSKTVAQDGAITSNYQGGNTIVMSSISASLLITRILAFTCLALIII